MGHMPVYSKTEQFHVKMTRFVILVLALVLSAAAVSAKVVYKGVAVRGPGEFSEAGNSGVLNSRMENNGLLVLRLQVRISPHLLRVARTLTRIAGRQPRPHSARPVPQQTRVVQPVFCRLLARADFQRA